MFCRGKCSLMLFDVWLAGRYAISCSWMSGSHMSDSCKADTIHVQKKMMVLVLAHCYGTGNGSFMKKWYNLIGIFVLRFFVFVESNYTLDKCIFRCQIWVKVIFFFYSYLIIICLSACRKSCQICLCCGHASVILYSFKRARKALVVVA